MYDLSAGLECHITIVIGVPPPVYIPRGVCEHLATFQGIFTSSEGQHRWCWPSIFEAVNIHVSNFSKGDVQGTKVHGSPGRCPYRGAVCLRMLVNTCACVVNHLQARTYWLACSVRYGKRVVSVALLLGSFSRMPPCAPDLPTFTTTILFCAVGNPTSRAY